MCHTWIWDPCVTAMNLSFSTRTSRKPISSVDPESGRAKEETRKEEKDSLSVGRELNVADGFLEVEVVQDGRALKVDEDRTAIFVDRDEDGLVGRERDPRDVLAILERQRARLVAVHTPKA